MKPSRRARIAAAITLSKGKMYEYGVPLEDHLDLPADLNLEQQFPLAIGTVGDFAAEAVMKAIRLPLPDHTTPREEVIFAAQVLQAFDGEERADRNGLVAALCDQLIEIGLGPHDEERPL